MITDNTQWHWTTKIVLNAPIILDYNGTIVFVGRANPAEVSHILLKASRDHVYRSQSLVPNA
eukprot:scaffold222_cov175-Amphora_coffeaeformis.AAC.10